MSQLRQTYQLWKLEETSKNKIIFFMKNKNSRLVNFFLFGTGFFFIKEKGRMEISELIYVPTEANLPIMEAGRNFEK